jgi:phosphoribosyl 1,2-cyclic phosphodiesterase
MEFCTIASGSSGNCTFVGNDHVSLLIDAGISGKRIEEGLNKAGRSGKDLDGILITHEHIDHIRSIGVLARKYKVPVYATGGTMDYLFHCSSLGRLDRELFHKVEADRPFSVGGMVIEPFHIMHDAAEPVGYRIEADGKKFAVATDMGCYDDYIIEHLKGLDSIVIESNHDINMLQVGKYPYRLKQRILGERGHLSNASSGQLLSKVLNDHLQGIFLGHLSQENNLPELAFETVRVEIMFSDTGYRPEELPIRVAKRSAPSPLVEF